MTTHQFKNQLEQYRKFARIYHIKQDPAHDFRHIERILRRLDMLAEGMSPPPLLYKLYFLVCFQGLGRVVQEHEEIRAEILTFLKNLGWEQQEIEEMFISLQSHLTEPTTVEEMIVHDANYLELLGAFGIAKAFLTGGARGQTYEETADIFEYCYLDKIHFFTPAGKHLAEDSRRYAKAFLNKLRSEW